MTKNICRTCLSSDGELISLFSATSRSACLLKKIMNISQILIQKQDNLPYMICKKCVFLVESFDCFKKQIESADTCIKNASQRRKERFTRMAEIPKDMVIFCESDEECNDLDYVVEYISDEVKRDVEDAFKQKRKNMLKKKLIKACATLNKLQDVALVPMEHIVNQKKVKETEGKRVTIKSDKSYQDEKETGKIEMIYAKNHKKIPDVHKDKNFNPLNIDPCKQKHTMIQRSDEMNAETFQIRNCCSANDNVVMKTEALENTEQRTFELGCDNRKEILESELEYENWNEQILKPLTQFACDGKKENVNFDKSWKIVYEPSEIDCGNNERVMKIEIVNEIEKKNVETDFNNKIQIVETEKPDETMETTFQPNETDFNVEDKNIEIEIPNEIVEKELYFSLPDSFNGDQSMYSEQLDKMKSTMSENFSNVTNTIIETETAEKNINTSQSGNYNYENEDKVVDDEGFDDIKQKALKPKEPCEIEKKYSKRSNEKRKIIEGKKPNDDFIVISSESSDEERYRAFANNGIQTQSCRSSRLARTSTIRLLRRKLVPKKDKMEKKTFLKEPMNNNHIVQTLMANHQPGKYFLCTTCKISLRSVTAVLYHHNEKHTPSHESSFCQMCDKLFPTKKSLFQHFDQHLEAHLYRCSECNCEFVLKKNLQVHINCHAKEKLEQPENKRLKMDNENLKRECGVTNGDGPKEKIVESIENIISAKSEVEQMEINSDETAGHGEVEG